MPIYSLQHQFLTDTANIQTFQCGDVKGASEQYLFAMNNEMIRTVANTNFFAVPTSDDDSKKRTAVNLPLRFNRNSTTKKYDAYASQQHLCGLVKSLMVRKTTVRLFTNCVLTDYLRIGWNGSDRAMDYG